MQKGNKKELKKNKKILKADKITYILKKYFLKFVLKVKRHHLEGYSNVVHTDNWKVFLPWQVKFR